MMSETMIPLLELVSKLLIYLGSAAVIGSGFILMLLKESFGLIHFIRRYMFAGIFIAMLAVGANFYAQVGSFAESGWAGMFDPDYVVILWDSPVGNSVLLRLIALGLGVCILITIHMTEHLLTPVRLMMKIISVLLAASFCLIGHTAELPIIFRILLGYHVWAALLWMGALIPLWYACQVMPTAKLQSLMHRFGVLAMWLVAVLLACGVVLAYQLVGSVNALITTPYGLMLLAKVGLVAVILGFAAWHKYRLVPQLTDQVVVLRLQRSIGLESLVGLAILLVTVLLTTVVGPDGMH